MLAPISLFTHVIYQPFLNIVVFFYWGLSQLGNPDMGIAVILLTLVVRFLMLPISWASHQSEKERREIADRLQQLEHDYSDDPVLLREKSKHVFRVNRRIVISEIFALFIQVSIALMLWRMFETGLNGEDLHLLYPFLPHVDTPYNMMFLGKYDLTHTNLTLNFIQSFAIFVLETVALLTSPYKTNRAEVVRLQLTLPVVSFLIFMRLPAGKKLFVITTLIVSTIITIVKYIQHVFSEFADRKRAEEEAAAAGIVPEEKIVTEIG